MNEQIKKNEENWNEGRQEDADRKKCEAEIEEKGKRKKREKYIRKNRIKGG